MRDYPEREIAKESWISSHGLETLMEALAMSQMDTLQEKIEKAKVVLAESRVNFENNPESYSARLLLLSTEIYLADLLKQLDIEIAADQPPQSISARADAGAAVKRGANG